MTEALFTDPDDQSLWFYYQFLMTTLVEPAGNDAIVPELTPADRAAYIRAQITNMKDILEVADDCKWVYNVLMEYTIALWATEGRQPAVEETQECKEWLAHMRQQDPLRHGRWDDLERSWQLE
jgi:geranylgeranyl transferase type-2 subunit alpha